MAAPEVYPADEVQGLVLQYCERLHELDRCRRYPRARSERFARQLVRGGEKWALAWLRDPRLRSLVSKTPNGLREGLNELRQRAARSAAWWRTQHAMDAEIAAKANRKASHNKKPAQRGNAGGLGEDN